MHLIVYLLGGKTNLDNTFYFIKHVLIVVILRLRSALAFWARNTCSQFKILFLLLPYETAWALLLSPSVGMDLQSAQGMVVKNVIHSHIGCLIPPH